MISHSQSLHILSHPCHPGGSTNRIRSLLRSRIRSLLRSRVRSLAGGATRLMAGACVLLLAWMANPALAHDHSFGSHGMALFGDRDGLYASHLPLFRAPHEHQVVLKVRLADPALDRALRAQLHGKTALWTIEPERFELSRLDPQSAAPLRAFSADVFTGHFERDGQRVHAKAQLVVEQVLVYRRLDPALHSRKEARYLPVGSFLVKEIDSRPDYDHIVALSAPAPGVVTVAKAGLDNPEAALKSVAPVRGTVYFETGDLR